MSSRLAFQTQLASIMEVLANAAVAEICKLVDDDYALVSLQMSQCQRENKVLKRKLHLLELKMARGAAERRLRDSAMNNSRPRVHLTASDRLRDATPASGGVFERQVEASLWPTRVAGEAPGEPILSESMQSQSPDVELVEPEALLVKEEKVETNMSQVEEAEEHVRLIGDDGVLECTPRGAAAQRPTFQPQDSQNQSMKQRSDGGGVEKSEEPDVVLVKVEEGEPAAAAPNRTGLSIQEGLVESSTDNYQGVLPFDETSSNQLSDLRESGRDFSELTQGVSKDSNSIVAVQLRVADTNTPPNPNSQQQRSSSSNPLGSEYSLFELETFFTRWAPDRDSAALPRGPSCSFSTDDSMDCDQNGVTVVETEQQPDLAPQPPAVRLSGQSFSKGGRSGSQGVSEGSSVSTASQPPWSRTPVEHQTSTSMTLSSAETPHVAVPARGPVALLNGVEVALAAQYRSDLLAATMTPSERRLKRYVCRTCGKAFSGLSNLEAHERVHTGEKPFRCDTCGKRFSEAGNLKKHQRVHTGEKPFSCQQCGKRFAWICNLRTHQQSATGCGGTTARSVTHC